MKKTIFAVALINAVITAVVSMSAPRAARAGDFETGPNVSGESTTLERRELIKNEPLGDGDSIRKDDNMRIDVPLRADGRPQRLVRGLSRTEKMEMDDLENRYNQGLIGEAEFYSRRNAMMERIGLEPEY